MVERAGVEAKLGFPAHPHMLRHACGFALANKGHDTRALQVYLGHRNIPHTVRYTELRTSGDRRSPAIAAIGRIVARTVSAIICGGVVTIATIAVGPWSVPAARSQVRHCFAAAQYRGR